MDRQASIGEEGFQEEVQAGQAAAADAELLDTYQDDRAEDIMADFSAGAGAETLLPLPAQTQDTTGASVLEDTTGASVLEELKVKHPSLQSKACALKDAWARHTQISAADEDDTPYDLLGKMHSSINCMAEGDGKNESVVMMNVIMPLFRAARKNADLRKFISDLFAAQDRYYTVKLEKSKLNKKISMLTKLYNEQEKETLLANLQSVQEKRELDIKRKGQAKAEAKAEAVGDKKNKKQKTDN